MFTQLKIDELNRQQRNYNYLKQKNKKPNIPNTNILNSRIIQYAKNNNGIIAGSFALKVYNPKYKKKINDIDIISKNPRLFAVKLANYLNTEYNTNRFSVVKGVHAYRIYDKNRAIYVADIVSYPINKNEYEKVNGLKAAKPEFVFKGKRKKYRTQKLDFSKYLM